MSKRLVPGIWGLILITGAGIAAQSVDVRLVPAPPAGVRLLESWRPVGVSKQQTRIVGSVVDIRQVPVANASVQVRNLVTGQITLTGFADDNGEYEFILGDPGTYVVEMTVLDGTVVALSNAGTVFRYETLQTVVQLPGRWAAGSIRIPPNTADYFGMTSAATMTAATMTIAADQNVSAVDSGEPVSPTKP